MAQAEVDEYIVERDYEIAQRGIPNFIQIGREFGHIKRGHKMKDYLNDAVIENGYETIGVHGVQGSGKSCLTIQIGADISYPFLKKKLGRDPTPEEMWNMVLDTLVFKPTDFIKRLKSVSRTERMPFILWDDIGVHYTNTTFKTDVDQYQAVDAMWAAIRTKVAIVVVNIPLFLRLAKNVRDNLTFEVYVGRNKMVQIRRIFYLPGTRYLAENLFKPIVQRPYKFNIHDVPQWVWDRYWSMRLDLTEEALKNLEEVTDMEDAANWTPIKDLAFELGKQVSTISQDCSRGGYIGKKIRGVMCIRKDDAELLRRTWARRHGKTTL